MPTTQRPSRPRRDPPSLDRKAPLLVAAVGASAGILVDRLFWSPESGVWLTFAVVCAGASRLRRVRGAAVALAFLSLGGMWHHIWWWDVGAGEFGRPDRWPAWVRGTIVEEAIYRPGGDWPGHPGLTRAVLKVCSRRHNDGWKPSEGRLQLVVMGDRSDLNLGDPVEAMGMLSPIGGPLNPGEANLRDYWRARGVWSRLHVDVSEGVAASAAPEIPGEPWLRFVGRARRRALAALTKALDPESLPVASALLLGRREAVDPELNDAFGRTGTTHLLAISGLHLQALAWVVWWCLRASGCSRRNTWIGVGASCLGYSLLVGFAPSVVRSLVMTVLTSVTGIRSRRPEPAQILSGAALITLAYNPSNLFDVGCQLSFLAVAAIAWGVPPIFRYVLRPNEEDPLEELVRSVEPTWLKVARACGRKLWEGVVVSSVVWFAAFPLVAYRFHVSSPLGILLNIPLVPLTTFALFASGASVLLASVWPPLAVPFAWTTWLLLQGTERLVRWGAGQSWGSRFVGGPSLWWIVGFYLIFVLLIYVEIAERGRLGRRLGLMCLWLGAGFLFDRAPRPTRVDFLAVGHGLAVVVQSEGHAALYDAGRMGDQGVGRRIIAPALWKLGVSRLDAAFLSHSDADHYNGLPDVLDRIPTDAVYVPTSFSAQGDPAAEALLDEIRKRDVPIRTFDEGDVFTLASRARFQALHPPAEFDRRWKDNELSLVLDFESAGRRVLLTGDLEGRGLQRMLSTTPPDAGFDVLSSPHHGAKAANPQRLFEWAGPSVVVASQRPPTGLPPNLADPPEPSDSDVDVEDALADVVGDNARLIRTWRRGATSVVWNGDRLDVDVFAKPERDKPLRNRSVHPLNFYEIGARLAASPAWLVTAAFLLLGLAAAFALFVIEWGAAALTSPRRRRSATDADGNIGGGEVVRAKGTDGADLVGTWFASENPRARTLLLLHGLAEDRWNLRPQAEAFLARGWNTAILDGRGFGESDGEVAAFGGLEAEDLRRWIDALEGRIGPGGKLAVWGRSMGAVIALRAASSRARIGALILEAPYADLRATLTRVLGRYRVPLGRWFAGRILGKAARVAKASLHVPRPIDVAARVNVPVVLVRGTEDRLVTLGELDALSRAFAAAVERIDVPGAGHSNVFATGGDRLAAELADFLDRVLPVDS